jgi:hypothetical protein
MTLSLFKMVRNIVRVVKLIFLQSPVVVTVCRREQVPLGFAHVIAQTTNANQCVPVVDRECVDHSVLEDLGGHSKLAGVQIAFTSCCQRRFQSELLAISWFSCNHD